MQVILAGLGILRDVQKASEYAPGDIRISFQGYNLHFGSGLSPPFADWRRCAPDWGSLPMLSYERYLYDVVSYPIFYCYLCVCIKPPRWSYY